MYLLELLDALSDILDKHEDCPVKMRRSVNSKVTVDAAIFDEKEGEVILE